MPKRLRKQIVKSIDSLESVRSWQVIYFIDGTHNVGRLEQMCSIYISHIPWMGEINLRRP